MSTWLVTGTDTDAGKTVATAALAVHLGAPRADVVVVKPAQTGLAPGEEGDVQQVARLVGLDEDHALEGSRVPEPLAPTTAARRAGVQLPGVAETAAWIARLDAEHEQVLVEGAGGVLVGLDSEGATLLDLADELRAVGVEPRVLVVARAGLGTLNHTGLTCQALRIRGNSVTGVVVGALPDEPDLAMRCNLEELHLAAGADVVGVLPAGLGGLAAPDFAARVAGSLDVPIG